MKISRFFSTAMLAATTLTSASLHSARAAGAGETSAEISSLKRQLHLLEQRLDKLQQGSAAGATKSKVAANSQATAALTTSNGKSAAKAPPLAAGALVSMPSNRPTICTDDGENCVGITGRVHWDVGGYDYRPNTAATSPQRLNSGENVRRARIGLAGKFFGDWNFALVYDFGGSSDGFGGAAAGSLPGGGLSGLENAYLSYTGLKPFGGKMAIEGGIMDIPWTIDEATSSNDITFMERSSAQVIAVNVAAGDFRSTFGTRWWNDSFWAGGYVTGPTTGSIHSASSVTPAGATEQFGAVARVAGQLISGNNYSLHLGANAEWLVQPSRNLVTNTQTVSFSDRPELRIDPTALISTGAIANASGAQVYGAEAAANYGSLYFQGEYYWYNVDRSASTGLPPIGAPSLHFQGGYAQASFVLTGEARTYNASTGSYNGIKPADPFSMRSGGWGAWEVAGRVSTIDLNDGLATAAGVAGGRQTVYTAALNWYINGNLRLMLDYLHGDVARQQSPTSTADRGAMFDAVAMRTQLAF
ncbi:OprO/OprP family phosphate-selective porin [Bradyrhizobium sp. CCBAU 53380]|uniref:OprO/OprP family phosphate-selective porin n=1 Tax=Bradyrhizobium sp. CCBAU 53380 TaxID=1325117 RepID=UPI0023028301|nr:OprO/OprP family phosphate-selective porin [Bradyrhizobium sp. CCBAU 53380]MDA9424976.1 porin [Bradyrhizobium sp. CCBAU 53380]